MLLLLVSHESRGASSSPPGGALTGERFRTIVSTDIGGSDPDDFQSMVHYLGYADLFDTEGLISSPPGAGRQQHLLEALEAYAADYSTLRTQSARFPSPDALRAITKQGALEPSPEAGHSTPTEGSRWIIERARADDPRPLWILVWGSLTDVAQALHDDPGIKRKLRVYFISSWNRRMDPAARDYVVQQHPDLWLIEADTTFRGMYVGGRQEGDLGNRQFIARHVKGHGALGDLLAAKKADIKMGDTPSVLYLLRGEAENPAGESWGGSFVRPRPEFPYWTDHPDPALREGNHPGARTVNRWRENYLRDWQQRLAWLTSIPIRNADFEQPTPDGWSWWSRAGVGSAEPVAAARFGRGAVRLRQDHEAGAERGGVAGGNPVGAVADPNAAGPPNNSGLDGDPCAEPAGPHPGRRSPTDHRLGPRWRSRNSKVPFPWIECGPSKNSISVRSASPNLT